MADDFVATTATKGVVPVGQFVGGNLEVNNDKDWFAVSLQAGKTYNLDVSGSASGGGTLAKPYLMLYGPTGLFIGLASNGGPGGDPRYGFTPLATGIYFLGVEASGFGTPTGTYSVSAAISGTVDDFAATTATKGAVPVGQSVTGSLEVNNDKDWFAVSLQGGTTYNLDVSGSASGGGTLAKPYLYLYGPTGLFIGLASNGGPGGDPRYGFTPTASGTYFVGVEASGFGTPTGTYSVSAKISGTVDDFGATTATKGAVPVGQSVAGNLEANNDKDWFAVSLQGGTTYNLDVSGSASGGGTLAKPYLYLYGPTGLFIGLASNGGPGGDPRYGFTPTASGTYFVGVEASGFGTPTGTYSVSAAVVAPLVTIGFSTVSVSRLEGDTGTAPLTFSVVRTGDSTWSGSVAFAVAGSGVNASTAQDFAGGTLPTGAISFSAGQSVVTISLSAVGDRIVEADETFTVSLSSPSSGAMLGLATASGMIVNDDVAPSSTISLGRLQAARAEGQSGSTAFTFLATRSGNVAAAASASWAVTAGTMAGTVSANGADFAGGVLPRGVVTFGPGQASRAITVSVKADVANELNESFVLSLSNPSTGVALGTASATGVIYNDDAPGTGTLSISRASAQKPEGHSGTTAFTFTVLRSGATSGSASADWSVTGGGAVATSAAQASDFAGGVLPSGRVSFAAGQLAQTVTVTLAGDIAAELNESFTVTLAQPQTGVTLGVASAVGVIFNDDFVSTSANQVLTGSDAADVFLLGGGVDTVRGRAGADAFRFQVTALGPSSENATTLLDFNRSLGEVIDLRAIDAIAASLADDEFNFIGTAGFTGAGQLRWQDHGTLRLIQGEVTGDGVADMTIFVSAAGPVTGNWFLL
jgi:hypothetical protein